MGQPSRYCDWLRAGQQRDRSSGPGRVKDLQFSVPSKPALGSTQRLIVWGAGAFPPGLKRQGRKSDHLLPAEVKKT
jgi:hypothetical protein